MIAMVSPGASSTDHSLNTLRYADRIKEQRISSSRKPTTRAGSKSNVTANIEPSQQRLSRIAAALCWDPNTSRDSKLSASSPVPQTYPEESFADLDISGGDISDEISIEDIQQSNEGIEVELSEISVGEC